MGNQVPCHCDILTHDRAEWNSLRDERINYPDAVQNSGRQPNVSRPISSDIKPVTDHRLAISKLEKAIKDCPLESLQAKIAAQGVGPIRDPAQQQEFLGKELNALVSTTLKPALEMAQAAGVPKEEIHKLMAELGKRISKLHSNAPDQQPGQPQPDPNSGQPYIGDPYPSATGPSGLVTGQRSTASTGRGRGTGCFCALLKWLLPLVLAVVCLLASAWLLHVATHSYAREMSLLNRTVTVQRRHNGTSPAGAPTQLLAWDPFGGLDDPARDRAVHDAQADVPAAARVDVPAAGDALRYLNYSSAVCAAAFVLLALLWQELLVWCKVMFTNAILAIGQGALAAAIVTPVPGGWAACRELLGREGVSWLGQPRSLHELLAWLAREGLGRGLADCSQVLWAGRSYLLALYALGLYELVAVRTAAATASRGSSRGLKNGRRLLLFVLGSLLVAQQAAAVYCALARRLGYSAEIVMTLLATVLLYTGGPVASASKRWLRLCAAAPRSERRRVCVQQDDKTPCEGHIACRAEQLRQLSQEGNVFVPPCCLPLCCLAGRYALLSDDDLQTALIPSSQDQAAGVFESLRMENATRRHELSEWDHDP